MFVGRTSVEVLLHHVKTAPVPPSERVDTEIPAALEALVLSCLAKDPDERPPSAEWLAARLCECATAEDWTPARARDWWKTSYVVGRDAHDGAAPAPTPLRPAVREGKVR